MNNIPNTRKITITQKVTAIIIISPSSICNTVVTYYDVFARTCSKIIGNAKEICVLSYDVIISRKLLSSLFAFICTRSSRPFSTGEVSTYPPTYLFILCKSNRARLHGSIDRRSRELVIIELWIQSSRMACRDYERSTRGDRDTSCSRVDMWTELHLLLFSTQHQCIAYFRETILINRLLRCEQDRYVINMSMPIMMITTKI